MLVLTLLPAGVLAQDSSVAMPEATPAADSLLLKDVRVWFRQGDYDRAIEALREAVERGGHSPAVLQGLYLQLIKGYVLLGNDLKPRPQGREASLLNYQAARERIEECLLQPPLRNTRPEPEIDYPPEMVRLFADVRAEMLGAFRIVSVEPEETVVDLDGERLARQSDGTYLVDNLLVGPHPLHLSAEGHHPLAEVIDISANSTLERSYVLTRRKSVTWYALRAAAVAGAAVGLGFLISSGDGGTTEGPSTLPSAPPPPSR